MKKIFLSLAIIFCIPSISIGININDYKAIYEYVMNNTPSDKSSLAAAFYNVANECARNGKFKVAIRLYEDSLDYKDNNPSTYNNMASSYKYLGNLKRAERFYKKSIDVDPGYTNTYLQLALLSAYKNERKMALKYFQRYEQGNPNARSGVIYKLRSEISNCDVSLGGEELLELIE